MGIYLTKIPTGFKVIGDSDHSPFCAIENDKENIFGVQFHPEVFHTEEGSKIIHNFLFDICNCKGDWTPQNFIEESISKIKSIAGDNKVICALSGGVDSTVAAVLVEKAVGKNLICIHIDTGLMRKNESKLIEEMFKDKFNLQFIYIDASEKFLNKLKGIVDPEHKRKIIGNTFIEVFEE